MIRFIEWCERNVTQDFMVLVILVLSLAVGLYWGERQQHLRCREYADLLYRRMTPAQQKEVDEWIADQIAIEGEMKLDEDARRDQWDP